MTQVTCTQCQKLTDVPFEPTPGKPVYCDSCFAKKRADRTSGGPSGRGRGGGSAGGGGRGGGRGGMRDAPPRPQKFQRSDYPGHEKYAQR